MLSNEVFISECFAVDALASASVAQLEIASLHLHSPQKRQPMEMRQRAVEGAAEDGDQMRSPAHACALPLTMNPLMTRWMLDPL